MTRAFGSTFRKKQKNNGVVSQYSIQLEAELEENNSSLGISPSGNLEYGIKDEAVSKLTILLPRT